MDKENCFDCRDKPSVLYCSQCQKLLCAKCGIEKHGPHKDLMDCEDLEKAITKRFESKIQEAESKIQKEGAGITNHYLEESSKMIEKKLGENIQSVQDCKKHIQQEFEEAAIALGQEGKLKVEKLNQKINILKKIIEQEPYIGSENKDNKNGNDQFQQTLKNYFDLLDIVEQLKEINDEKKKKFFEEEIKNYCEKDVLQEMLETTKKSLIKKTTNDITLNAMPSFIYYMNSQGTELGWMNTASKAPNLITLYKTDGSVFKLPLKFGSASIDNAIYITGGGIVNEENTIETITNSAYQFSFLTERVSEIGSLITARKDHNMESLNQFIYVIGGRAKKDSSVDETMITSGCERLDISKGVSAVWDSIADLPTPRVGASVCSIRDKTNPTIYVIGGDNGNGYEKIICKFICATKVWESLETKWSLECNPRMNAGCFYFKDHGENKIVIFGGRGNTIYQDAMIFMSGDNKVEPYLQASLPEKMTFAQKNPAYSIDSKKILISGEMALLCFDKEGGRWSQVCKNEWFSYQH